MLLPNCGWLEISIIIILNCISLVLKSPQPLAAQNQNNYLADKDLKGGKAILKTCPEISKERLHFSDDYNTVWGSSRESMFDRFGLVQETESCCQVDDRNRPRFNDKNVNKYVEAITNTSRYTRWGEIISVSDLYK